MPLLMGMSITKIRVLAHTGRAQHTNNNFKILLPNQNLLLLIYAQVWRLVMRGLGW